MIRNAIAQDRKTIYDLHSSKVSVDRYDDMEFYFSRLYDVDRVIVNDLNGHVVSSLQVNYHGMILNDTRIVASMLFGAITQDDDPEYFKPLLEDVLDEVSRKTLVSLVITKTPKYYLPYGFETVYKRKTYEISRDDLKNRSFEGVGKAFDLPELEAVYRRFTSHFNGYYERDRDYWIKAFKQYQFLRNNIVVYRSEEGVVEGYLVYSMTQQKVYVDEIGYLNGTALIRLLCYALKYKNRAEVTVSESENLNIAIPKIKGTVKPVMMARINDYALFNRLYQSDVRKVPDGFKLGGKPLYINERC